MSIKKILLSENDIPRAWYNIVADMVNKPLPPLNPVTKQPLDPKDLENLFAKELITQELSQNKWIDIPDEVRELYKIWRPTPLVRATGLEKALDTPARIYFKNEGVSPIGSHKLNSALPQAYYNKKQGYDFIHIEQSVLFFLCGDGFTCNRWLSRQNVVMDQHRQFSCSC